MRSLSALLTFLFSFFFFSVQHFCVGVASGPHLQFFRAAEFETKAKIYRSFHQAHATVRREREREGGGKEVETAKMTISLFFSALISLGDK